MNPKWQITRREFVAAGVRARVYLRFIIEVNGFRERNVFRSSESN